MPSTGLTSPTANSGSFSSPSNAHADGGGTAQVVNPGDSGVWWGFAFGLSSAAILGISVRLDALVISPEDETTFTVELSWNSGASWTSAVPTTTLQDFEATYTLGGSASLWGRAWSVAELASGTFRVRVTAAVDGGPPASYELDWLAVDVTYTAGLHLTSNLTDSMSFTDVLVRASRQVALYDHVQVSDGGAGAAAGGGGGSYAVTGGGLDEIAGGGLTFEEAAEQFAMSETLAVQIITNSTSGYRVFNLSDTIAAQETTGPGTYQPGVLEWGDMVFDGVFGLESETTGVTLRVRNTTIADAQQVNPLEFAAQFQTAYMIGGSLRVNIYAMDGGVWRTKILFMGLIEECSLTEDYIEIRAFQVGEEETVFPTKMIDEAAFIWGDAEGKRPEGFMGTPVPIFCGRFGPTALQEFPTGHAFAWDNLTDFHPGGPAVSDNYRRYMQGIYYYMAHGLRFPMLAVPLGADMNRGYSAQAPALWDKMKQAIFVYGDRSAPVIMINRSNSQEWNFLTEYVDSAARPAEFIQHVSGCTWDGRLDKALLFARDVSSDLPSYYARGGAGDVLNIRSSGPTQTGGLSLASGFFLNRTEPDWGTTETPLWSGLFQCVAVKMLGLSRIRQTTGLQAYGTTSGVVNPDRALDPNPDTYAQIPVGQVLSLEGPTACTPLGAISQINLCVLLHPTSGVVACEVRWSHRDVATVSPIEGCTQNGAGVLNNGWLLMRFALKKRLDPILQDRITQGGGTSGFVDEWSFLHISPKIGAPAVYIAFPVDLAIKAVSGEGRPIYAWLEVFYKSNFQPEVRKQSWDVARKFQPLLQEWNTRRSHLPATLPAVPYGSGGVPDAQPGAIGRVLLAGTGPRDNGTARYTPTANSIVENPADWIGFLIEKYKGAVSFNARAIGTTFGSFIRARDRTNAVVPGSAAYSGWKMVVPVYDRTTFRAHCARIGAQSMTLFQQQLDNTGVPQWRAFVDEPDPATTAPERLYRTTGYLFTWDRLFPDSFVVRLTDRSSLASDFLLRYGHFDATGDLAFEKFVRPSSHNLVTSGAAYQTACSNAYSRYGTIRPLVVEAPDVWNHATAEALLKWYVDSRRERRVLIEFDTFVNACDLKPGHVIKMHDDIGLRIAYPGLRAGASWSSHQFNVLNVQVRKDAGRPVSVHVTALECYERAA